jgi:hypothetical protein
MTILNGNNNNISNVMAGDWRWRRMAEENAENWQYSIKRMEYETSVAASYMWHQNTVRGCVVTWLWQYNVISVAERQSVLSQNR